MPRMYVETVPGRPGGQKQRGGGGGPERLMNAVNGTDHMKNSVRWPHSLAARLQTNLTPAVEEVDRALTARLRAAAQSPI
jgi:hypothetical protein